MLKLSADSILEWREKKSDHCHNCLENSNEKKRLGTQTILNVMIAIGKFGEKGVIGLIAMIILYQLLEKK